jgi:hypothetical protein
VKIGMELSRAQSPQRFLRQMNATDYEIGNYRKQRKQRNRSPDAAQRNPGFSNEREPVSVSNGVKMVRIVIRVGSIL